MELALEILKYTATAAIAGFLGWFFSKLQTRREKKAKDLELINSAVTPLLKSISDLTHHYSETVDKLIKEQAQSRKLWLENGRLIGKVESLERQVDLLTTEIKKLTDEKSVRHTAD